MEIVAISISEKRIKTENPVQTKNKSRRFLKNWYKTGKSLNQIIETKCFSEKTDFIQILKEEFSTNKIDMNNFTTIEKAITKLINNAFEEDENDDKETSQSKNELPDHQTQQ